jgi:DNA-binding transcriptional LysR family regulator
VDLASNWSIWSGLSMMQESALMSRSVDIIVTGSEMGTSEDFERRHLLSEPYMLAVPKGRDLPVGSMQALAGSLPFIRFSARSLIGQQIELYLRRLKVDVPNRLEFDTSDAVAAMVGAGMGWAMMTPLCMLQAIPHIDNIELHPLPGPKSRRHLTMIYRTSELGPLPDKIYESAVAILRDTCFPQITARAPWIDPLLTIGEGPD